MAEIILPPEEETPQVPELNIDKPSGNSKVITIEFEAKKTNKVSTKDTNQQLYTTDTDAWFEFKETSLEGANGTYSVVFRNRHDGSIFQRTGDVVNGVAYYKIPHQEIRHAGAWRGQLVYTLENGNTTAREFDYVVKGHILDGKDVREIVVEDFETLMSQLNSMKDNAELELADLVNAAGRNELERQQFYESLVEDINDLQENYQELLDTGVLQTNINTKLEALEEEYAPKLTEVTAQLAQTAKQDEVNTLSTNKADKVNTYTKTEVYNKTEVDSKTWSLSNLGQDVKEAMTGGSVAVVGTDAVDTTNVKDEAIKFSKRTVLGNIVNVNYHQQPINFNTVDGSVTIPINTRFRSGLHSKLIESDLTIVTGRSGYYLMWDVQTGEIINVKATSGDGAYNENMVMIASVAYPMDVDRFKVEGLENYAVNGENRKIPSTEQTASGKTAYIAYGYGRCIDLNSTTGVITIPKDTVFRNGKYTLRTDSEITISLRAGYSYVFLDVDTNEFLALRYNSGAINFKESYLYVCSATWDNNSSYNDIQGVNKYTIDGVLNGLDIEIMKYSMDHPLFIPRKHRLVGHRGLSGLKPENTIPAFDECGIKGMFGVETDIRKTSDGHFVCMHDATVDKMTNGTGNVSDMTLEQIRSLTIDYGADIENYTDLKVPTLEEMLHSCARYGTVPMLHLYTDVGDEPAIVEIVNALGFEKSVIYTSTSPTMLNNIANISDSLVFSLGGSTSDLSNITPPTRNYQARYHEASAYDNYPNAIKDIHSHKMLATTWVVNDTLKAKELFEKGIDLIATDLIFSLDE